MKKVNAILTADIHLEDTTPVCRTDDYLEEQKKKLLFLNEHQEKHNCIVIDAGDLFTNWKASPWLINRAFELLPNEMFTITGNHDLPEHSLEQFERSALAVLKNNKQNFYVYSKEQYKGELFLPDYNRNILILHQLIVSSDDKAAKYLSGMTAKKVLKKYPDYDLIVTGDNHKPFVEKYKGRLLVNPGSMMRRTADQVNHKPRFYLYYAKENKVQPIYYPINKNVIDRSHIDVPQERKDRIRSYIERMNMKWDAGLSFKDNLKIFFSKNKTPQKIKDLIWEQMKN